MLLSPASLIPGTGDRPWPGDRQSRPPGLTPEFRPSCTGRRTTPCWKTYGSWWFWEIMGEGQRRQLAKIGSWIRIKSKTLHMGIGSGKGTGDTSPTTKKLGGDVPPYLRRLRFHTHFLKTILDIFKTQENFQYKVVRIQRIFLFWGQVGYADNWFSPPPPLKKSVATLLALQ